MKEYKIKPYDEAAHQGLVRHVLLRKGFSSGGADGLPGHQWRGASPRRGAGGAAKGGPECLQCIVFDVNTERTNVIMGTRIVNLYGPGYITDTIGDIRIPDLSPVLLPGESGADREALRHGPGICRAYRRRDGLGSYTAASGRSHSFLAQKAGKVYGVEIIPQAIEDASGERQELNGIENVEFFVGKAEEVLPEQYERNQVPCGRDRGGPAKEGLRSRCAWKRSLRWLQSGWSM